ncbi:MAG: DNA primase [Dehalococcoidales bacterium]|jgi:DNA primase
MSVIDEVKQKIDIAEVVGQYTTLKKAGRNLTALCPFHSEKTPSFFVFPERQSWHCFGACSTGGDVFSFLMKKEGLEFGEALRRLALKAGVALPEKSAPGVRKEEKEEYYQVNDAAAMYFHNLLLNSPAAAKAKSYVEQRGLTATSISDFQLGYSLDSWDALKLYLMERGYSEKLLVTAGLLYENEKGKTTDRFRGKLMIPIRDARGRVTGFGSRVLDDSQPKYINSPQTPTFDKSGTLYGIDRAAAEIRKQDKAIIMEGYMDVITAHQCGVTNAVASMGTAITETQVNILKKLSKNLYLSLDADAAGEEAMLRTVGYENVIGAEIKVIRLPEGKDPDEVMLEDMNSWDAFVAAAVPLIDFMFEKTVGKLDITSAGGKSKAVDGLLPVLAAINDPIRQAHYLQKLAALVKVDMDTIKASLGRLKPSPVKRRTAAPNPALTGTRAAASGVREEYFLCLLLLHPELKNSREDLSDYIINSENREIYRACQECADIPALKERLDPAIHEHLDAILNKTMPTAKNNVEGRFNDCVMVLRKTYLRNLAARRAESGESGESGVDTTRLEEDVAISNQLRELDSRKLKQRNATLGKIRR